MSRFGPYKASFRPKIPPNTVQSNLSPKTQLSLDQNRTARSKEDSGGVKPKRQRSREAIAERWKASLSSMEEQEFGRLLNLFPVVRSRDYIVSSVLIPSLSLSCIGYSLTLILHLFPARKGLFERLAIENLFRGSDFKLNSQKIYRLIGALRSVLL